MERRHAAASARSVGLVLNLVVASCWTLLSAIASGFGVFYLVDGLVSRATLHELGVAVGIFLLIGAGLGAAFSVWLLRVVARALRIEPPDRVALRLMVGDLLGAAATAWFLVETFKTAAGDGRAPNGLYVAGWVANTAILAIAGFALFRSRGR